MIYTLKFTVELLNKESKENFKGAKYLMITLM